MRRSVAHTNLVELAAPVFVRSGGPEREDSWNNELLAAIAGQGVLTSCANPIGYWQGGGSGSQPTQARASKC